MDTNLQNIKKEFFALRNGIVADTLRKAGMHYKIIFGLQLPQIAGIARAISPDLELAQALWADKGVRESRLLACYLFPLESVNIDEALKLAADVQTPEEGDILAFRIFKRLDFADEILEKMRSTPDIPMSAANSLARHLE